MTDRPHIRFVEFPISGGRCASVHYDVLSDELNRYEVQMSSKIATKSFGLSAKQAEAY